MKEMIALDDTRFIFETNFAGDPAKDHFGDSRRKANIVIPTKEQAEELLDMGFRVKKTKPGPKDDPDDYIPEYFVQAVLKYRDRYGKEMRYPPKVYLVNRDGNPVPLDEESVGELDKISVKNVNVILNPWSSDDGGKSLYIRTMYVEQDFDYDPYAEKYRHRNEEE